MKQGRKEGRNEDSLEALREGRDVDSLIRNTSHSCWGPPGLHLSLEGIFAEDGWVIISQEFTGPMDFLYPVPTHLHIDPDESQGCRCTCAHVRQPQMCNHMWATSTSLRKRTVANTHYTSPWDRWPGTILPSLHLLIQLTQPPKVEIVTIPIFADKETKA